MGVTELRGEVGLFPLETDVLGDVGPVALGEVFSMFATADWTAETLFVGVDGLDPRFKFFVGVFAAVLLFVEEGEAGWLVSGDKSLSRALECEGELVAACGVVEAWEGLEVVGGLVVGVFFGGR